MPDSVSRPETWIPYAWVEAIDDNCLFISTADSLAAFRIAELPGNWVAQFGSPTGNLIIACEVDLHGSPGNAAYENVVRLGWPMVAEASPPRIVCPRLSDCPAMRRSAATRGVPAAA